MSTTSGELGSFAFFSRRGRISHHGGSRFGQVGIAATRRDFEVLHACVMPHAGFIERIDRGGMGSFVAGPAVVAVVDKLAMHHGPEIRLRESVLSED